jgi:histone H3/H4
MNSPNSNHLICNDTSNSNKNDAMERDIRSALQMAILQIVIPQDRIHRTQTTMGAVRALTELVYQYTTKSLGPDLHQFSNHANRKSTIAPEDVALVLRKLPLLQEQLEQSIRKKQTETISNAIRRKPYNKNTKRHSTAELLSSSDDDDSSRLIKMPAVKKIAQPKSIATAAATTRTAITSPKSKPTKPKTSEVLQKKLPSSYAGTKAKVDRLLGDSSSDDDLPDFMKQRLVTARPKNRQQQQQQQPSQIMAILEGHSSDSGLSSGPAKANDDSDEEDVIVARPTKRTKQVILSSQDDADDDSEMEF